MSTAPSVTDGQARREAKDEIERQIDKYEGMKSEWERYEAWCDRYKARVAYRQVRHFMMNRVLGEFSLTDQKESIAGSKVIPSIPSETYKW
jgi:hypothetical protein